jgi:hypothetical protein
MTEPTDRPSDYFLYAHPSDAAYNARLLRDWPTMSERQKHIARLNAGAVRVTPNYNYRDT